MNYHFWFIIGSQHLYGDEVLEQVKQHGLEMTRGFANDNQIPFPIEFHGVMTSPEEITQVLRSANNDDTCAGVIAWMHTFSPSKMWIQGLRSLNKPYLHINTQFNRNIPYDSIDMNFMNTNQSAHGDREHGFITARLRMRRKVICGYWEDNGFRNRMRAWMRSAVGVVFSRQVKVLRLGDNMRYVAVTEGDKIQAEQDFGWAVNTYGVGALEQAVQQVTNQQIDDKMNEYRDKYDIDSDDEQAIRYQAKLEVALEYMLESVGAQAFTDCFEDLYGLEQLPGLAAQNLMGDGYGFGAEGDWKQAALAAVMTAMSNGLDRGLSFIEDYTYHFEPGNEAVLGAHMLEISPAIAQYRPSIEVHPLGIGNKEAPARLVFQGRTGPAILVTLVDMGGRFRMIVHDVTAVAPDEDMPNLPVARVMWRPQPDMITGNEAWILCGGTHHSVISYDLTAQHIQDFAEMMGVECIHIHSETRIDDIKIRLQMGDLIYA